MRRYPKFVDMNPSCNGSLWRTEREDFSKHLDEFFKLAKAVGFNFGKHNIIIQPANGGEKKIIGLYIDGDSDVMLLADLLSLKSEIWAHSKKEQGSEGWFSFVD